MYLRELLVVMDKNQYVRIYRTDYVDWCTCRLFIGKAVKALEKLKEYHYVQVRMIRISVDEHEDIYVYIEVQEE